MPKETSPDDPRGLISEAYRIEDIPAPECRSIFLDWALEPRGAGEMRAAVERLLTRFQPAYASHPMTAILQEAMIEISTAPKRRGGRAGRG